MSADHYGSEAARAVAELNEHPNSSGKEATRQLAYTLIKEECAELIEAAGVAHAKMSCGCEYCQKKYRHVLSCVARELADVVYVAYTTAWAHDLDLDAALAEIHRAAMSKMEANVRREDGKIIKHPGFTPPDMTEAVSRVA